MIGNIEIDNRLVLAPMAGISNSAFRRIVKEMGAGLIFAEMVSSNALVYENDKTLSLLKTLDCERPIVQQIFGSGIETFVKSAKIVMERQRPDIIDINMGCPVPKVALRAQAGSALLKDPQKIGEIVREVVKAVNVPVTIKIRSGWDKDSINAVQVAKIAEENGAQAITVHARTRAQGYTGKADWKIIKSVKEAVKIPVIGNGDVTSAIEAKKMLDETGCDAVMIGRGALGNPWIFKECLAYLEEGKIIDRPTDKEKILMIKKHYELIKEDKGVKAAVLQIRTHALYYLKGMPKAKIYKELICKAKSEEEFLKILDDYLSVLEKLESEK